MATISSLEIPVSCKVIFKHTNRLFGVAITKLSILDRYRIMLFFGDKNPDHPVRMYQLWGDL